MKAIRVYEFGNPDVMRLEKGEPQKPAGREVVVKVYAAGVNPVDIYIRTGTYETTPPSGMTFYTGTLFPHLEGDLFVATLRSRALVRIRIEKGTGEVLRIERCTLFPHEQRRRPGYSRAG